MDSEKRKHPIPWRVLIERTTDGTSYCNGVVDANGQTVIETDAGYYPPDVETAEMLVKAVNSSKR